jgi:hypothetical protein
MGEMRYVYKFLVGKPERNRPFRKPGRRWEDREIGWKFVDGIHLDQDRSQWRTFVNTVMNLRIP